MNSKQQLTDQQMQFETLLRKSEPLLFTEQVNQELRVASESLNEAVATSAYLNWKYLAKLGGEMTFTPSDTFKVVYDAKIVERMLSVAYPSSTCNSITPILDTLTNMGIAFVFGLNQPLKKTISAAKGYDDARFMFHCTRIGVTKEDILDCINQGNLRNYLKIALHFYTGEKTTEFADAAIYKCHDMSLLVLLDSGFPVQFNHKCSNSVRDAVRAHTNGQSYLVQAASEGYISNLALPSDTSAGFPIEVWNAANPPIT